MVDDAQTHTLPTDEAGLQHIALFLGFATADAFAAELKRQLGTVERHYAQLFEEAPTLAARGNLVFTGIEDDPDTLETLRRHGLRRSPRHRRHRPRLAPRPLSRRRAASERASC